MMKPFVYLPIPVDDRVPKGYRLIVAYAKDDTVVIPIDVRELGNDNLHACDWEGCSSVEHVVRFSIKEKYQVEDKKEGDDQPQPMTAEERQLQACSHCISNKTLPPGVGTLTYKCCGTRQWCGLKERKGS